MSLLFSVSFLTHTLSHTWKVQTPRQRNHSCPAPLCSTGESAIITCIIVTRQHTLQQCTGAPQTLVSGERENQTLARYWRTPVTKQDPVRDPALISCHVIFFNSSESVTAVRSQFLLVDLWCKRKKKSRRNLMHVFMCLLAAQTIIDIFRPGWKSSWIFRYHNLVRLVVWVRTSGNNTLFGDLSRGNNGLCLIKLVCSSPYRLRRGILQTDVIS